MIVGKNISGKFDSKQISPLEVTVTPHKSIQHLMLDAITRAILTLRSMLYVTSKQVRAGNPNNRICSVTSLEMF